MVNEIIYTDEESEEKIKMYEREKKEEMRKTETYELAVKFWNSPQGKKAIKQAIFNKR